MRSTLPGSAGGRAAAGAAHGGAAGGAGATDPRREGTLRTAGTIVAEILPQRDRARPDPEARTALAPGPLPAGAALVSAMRAAATMAARSTWLLFCQTPFHRGTAAAL